MTVETIHVGVEAQTLYIIPRGHITASLCPSFKRVLEDRLAPHSGVGELTFDLSSCEYMDSTFLGLVVHAAKLLKRLSGSLPAVYRASEACISLFRTMGLMKMLDFRKGTCRLPESMMPIEASGTLTPGLMLDAHRELSGLSDKNRQLFERLEQSLLISINSRKKEPE